jgi:hypothetical protein
VKWAHTARGTTLDVTVPVNVTASVVLDGKTYTVGSGRTHFGR